jgi:hypothetical protein
MVAVKAIENPRSHATNWIPACGEYDAKFCNHGCVRAQPNSPCGEPISPFVVSLSNHEHRAKRGREKPRRTATIYVFGVWRSLVAHLHGVQGVVGSNPITPTKFSIQIKGLQLTRL